MADFCLKHLDPCNQLYLISLQGFQTAKWPIRQSYSATPLWNHAAKLLLQTAKWLQGEEINSFFYCFFIFFATIGARLPYAGRQFQLVTICYRFKQSIWS